MFAYICARITYKENVMIEVTLIEIILVIVAITRRIFDFS